MLGDDVAWLWPNPSDAFRFASLLTVDAPVIAFITVIGAATIFVNTVRLIKPPRRRRAADGRQLLLGLAMVAIAGLALVLGRGWSADAYGLVSLAGGCAAVWATSDFVVARRHGLE